MESVAVHSNIQTEWCFLFLSINKQTNKMQQLLVLLTIALLCSSCAAFKAMEGHLKVRDPSTPKPFSWRGGPVLPNAEITNVYWSASVKNQTQLDAFARSMVASTYITTLYEYSITGSPIGAAKFMGSANAGSMLTYFNEDDLATVLNNMIDTGKIAAANSNSLYQVYIDAATTTFNLSSIAAGASCGTFCGVHFHFNTTSGGIAYFGINADCPTGCGGANSLDTFTIVSSHEMVEAITDPYFLNRAWNDAAGSELADYCSPRSYTSSTDGLTWRVDGWYSNQLGNCTTVGPVSNTSSSGAGSISSFLWNLFW